MKYLTDRQVRNLKLTRIAMPKWRYIFYEFFYCKKHQIKHFIDNFEINYSNNWIYLKTTNMGFYQISIGIDDNDYGDINTIKLILPFFYLSLSTKKIFMKKGYSITVDTKEYISFNIYYDAIGDKSDLNYYYFPWSYKWYQTKYLGKNKEWIIEKKGNRLNTYGEEWDAGLYTEVHDYVYVLKNGNIIKTKATVTIREMEWRRKGLMFSKIGNLVRKTIDVNFDKEIGEGTGTYKGGVIGTGYEMKEGETLYQTLKRMEKNYKC